MLKIKILLLITSLSLCSPTWSGEIALISSGGVSLGSYEGGVLQEFISSHKSTLPKDLKVVLGASAGGMNGLLTVFEACRIKPSPSDKSLLWKMWIPVGLDQLQNDDPGHKSLFHRRTIHSLFNEMKEIWQEGFKESCDLVFGVTVTRKDPLVEDLRPGLSMTRQPEIFLVRIKGKGEGRLPLIQNYNTEEVNSYRVSLPLTDQSIHNLELVFGLVQASASFPVAFKPFPLSYCLYRPGEEFKECRTEKVITNDFVDGGIYNNGPVGKGFEILKKENPRSRNFEVIYVNASAPLENQNVTEEKLQEEDWGVISEMYGLGLSFLTTSRNMSLSESLQHFPELVRYVKTNEKQFPLVSEPLYAFMGFVEEDFRISDFYLGESDGQKLFQSQHLPNGESSCFHKHLQDPAAGCALREDLKILTKLALTRKKDFPKRESVSEVFQFLEKSKFHFKDLGLKRNESRYGRIALKNRFRKLARALILKQPENLRSKTKLVLDHGLNQITFYPSANYGYALVGNSPEVGLSMAYRKHLNVPTAFRLNTSLMMFDYFSQIGRSASNGLAPMVGFRYQPEFFGNSLWQFNVGLRTGYIISGKDNVGRKSCDTEKVKTQLSECSGLIFQQVTAVTFLERLRIQLVYQPDYGNHFGKFLTSNIYFQVGLVFPDIW